MHVSFVDSKMVGHVKVLNSFFMLSPCILVGSAPELFPTGLYTLDKYRLKKIV